MLINSFLLNLCIFRYLTRTFNHKQGVKIQICRPRLDLKVKTIKNGYFDRVVTWFVLYFNKTHELLKEIDIVLLLNVELNVYFRVKKTEQFNVWKKHVANVKYRHFVDRVYSLIKLVNCVHDIFLTLHEC